MPLPTPNKDEPKDAFISRCIETDVMNDEFPNLTQRIAVCVSQYDNKDKPKKTKTIKDDVRENKDCPDGFEHLMPNGEYMCGKTHQKKQNY